MRINLKTKITKEAFWELVNSLMDEKEEKDIEKIKTELLKKYEVVKK